MTAGLPVGTGGGGDADGRAEDAVPVRVQVGGMDAAADEAFGDGAPECLQCHAAVAPSGDWTVVR